MSVEQQQSKQNNGMDKAVTIIVNGRERSVTEKELTFDRVVDLAFDDPQRGPQIEFTITYRRGHGDKPEGSLVEGDTLKVKAGMIVNVTRTDKS
jgi:hypothetical protein